MAQKNVLNKVKTATDYDTLYPLTPYQIYVATNVASSSSGSAYVLTIPFPANLITSYIFVAFKPNITNAAACTISINNLSAYTLYSGGASIAAGALSTSLTYLIKYDYANGNCELIASATGNLGANQAQALGASDNTTYMTPLRTGEYFDSKKANLVTATALVDDTKYMTPYKVKCAIDANYLPHHQMSIKTGTITNNGTIPQTSGYSNYLYIVTPNTASNNFAGNTSHVANDDYNGFRFYCSVDQVTRKVTAYTESYYYTNGNIQGWTNQTSLTADYYEIAWN